MWPSRCARGRITSASFNELRLATPPTHRLFIDSTLDWGQDLPGLKQWLDNSAPGEKTFLSYFGSGDPVFEGITATGWPTTTLTCARGTPCRS